MTLFAEPGSPLSHGSRALLFRKLQPPPRIAFLIEKSVKEGGNVKERGKMKEKSLPILLYHACLGIQRKK
jgi:hypothetical protein